MPRIANVMKEWESDGCDRAELVRRLVDLFFVSVLLDAGAGDRWRYVEPGTGKTYERSEGIAVASLHMFTSLAFTASEVGTAPMVNGNCCGPWALYVELLTNTRDTQGRAWSD